MFEPDNSSESREFELKEQWHFIEHLRGAEIHWFFIEAVKALQNELYIPACSCFLNGIEASMRITMAQAENNSNITELSPYKLLSNNLINAAKALGIPVASLAFDNEPDFAAKLASGKPNRIDVELVRNRHNICHGNILEFINSDLGEENRFFTPECLRNLAHQLHRISKSWVVDLGKYRHGVLGL
jgi:hypothetical protein